VYAAAVSAAPAADVLTIEGPARLGVGLWTFQSTAAAPTSLPAAYARFATEAALAESLGFHSVWLAEHRTWYDGWCPAPLHAAAIAAARTTTLRLGTAMLLLPQHHPAAVVDAVRTLDTLAPGRVELGVGLGYRDAEYDLLARRRDRRGRAMEAGLEVLVDGWPGAAEPSPRVWVGGFSRPALQRAARRGLRLMLPQTLSAAELEALVASHRDEAGGDVVVGVLRDVRIERDGGRAAAFRHALEAHYREEAGSWWDLGGAIGFARPQRLAAQIQRALDSVLVGPAEDVAEGLAAVFDAGADLVVARMQFPWVAPEDVPPQLEALALDVAPRLPSGRLPA
jgi:alkanesulfonate monooxygenase SsuD/methylene tetrahydromethanopterin reductase-like flavin-dependent oxidoreductase (luciferase family)